MRKRSNNTNWGLTALESLQADSKLPKQTTDEQHFENRPHRQKNHKNPANQRQNHQRQTLRTNWVVSCPYLRKSQEARAKRRRITNLENRQTGISCDIRQN